MTSKFITEISEEDFKKLNIEVDSRKLKIDENGNKLFEMEKVKLNEILENEIKFMIKDAYEIDQEWIKTPITIAIHVLGEDYFDSCYFDKFLNAYSGPQMYMMGCGIKHLYSTRDYFESKEDYWRVSKKETAKIYRIHIDKKWQDMFVLKHKIEKEPWPYEIPERVNKEGLLKAELVTSYDLDTNGDWVKRDSYGLFDYGRSSVQLPIDNK